MMILLLCPGQAVQQDKLQLSMVELGLLRWHTGDRELARAVREVWLCTGFVWQGFGGDIRGKFCEKLPETSPGFNGASASWLQDRPAAGQG